MEAARVSSASATAAPSTGPVWPSLTPMAVPVGDMVRSLQRGESPLGEELARKWAQRKFPVRTEQSEDENKAAQTEAAPVPPAKRPASAEPGRQLP